LTTFLTIADQTFDGSEAIQISTSFGEIWTYYPEGRAAASEVWANFQTVLGINSTQFFLTITAAKRLTVMNFSGAGTYTLMFKDADLGNDATVAAKFGFASASTTAAAGASITATGAITAHEVSHLDPRFTDISENTAGHGAGGFSPPSRTFELSAVCTRTVAAAFAADIEQDGFVGVADTENGGLNWTIRIGSTQIISVGTTKAQIMITGSGRV